MNPFLSFLLLLILHFATGYSILRLFRINTSLPFAGPLSMLTGVGIAAAIPFLLQLAYIPITPAAIFTALGIAALPGLVLLAAGWKNRPRPALHVPALYEWPALLVMLFLVLISAWRCYYNPVLPRDMLAGPEVIANYTLREQTFANSVFLQDLGGNNNPFKPLSVSSLQVIYKMAGFPFGQVWLSIIFVSFILFLYRVLSSKLHPVFAGILLLLFLAIPEMYAYTYMALFDYTNMVYFFLSCYFLFEYRTDRRLHGVLFAGVQMGIATYFRPETLVFTFMLLPTIWLRSYREQRSWKTYVAATCSFCLLPVLAYWLPNQLYNYHYLPVHYNIGSEVNQHLTDLGPLWQRFSDMNTVLIFCSYGITLYGYFIYFFLFMLVADFLKKRSFTQESRNWLYAILIIYFGLALIGFLVPLMDLRNTTKRGLFKLFPLMLLYLANSPVLQAASISISQWLSGKPNEPVKSANTKTAKKADRKIVA